MKNEIKINKKEIMSWAKHYYLEGVANKIMFALLCMLLAISLAMLTLLFLFGGDWINWYLSIFFLFLAVYKLFFERFVIWSQRYKVASKNFGVDEWTRTTEFRDDGILLTECTSTMQFKYQNIKKIKEKDNLIMILFNNNQALRLYKDTFVEGTWEECKEKINSMLK